MAERNPDTEIQTHYQLFLTGEGFHIATSPLYKLI